VGDNEPYAGGLEGDCMNRHAVKRGLPHTLVEVRQDLISDEAGVEEWTGRLARALETMIAQGQIRDLHS
jgi:predicted N-formylglutamate amidohydrolase